MYKDFFFNPEDKRCIQACTFHYCPKGNYTKWLTSDQALFHVSLSVLKTKIQDISREQTRKDRAVVLHQTSLEEGFMGWICMSCLLTEPYFSEQKKSIYLIVKQKYLNTVSMRLNAFRRQFRFHQASLHSHTGKYTIIWFAHNFFIPSPMIN